MAVQFEKREKMCKYFPDAKFGEFSKAFPCYFWGKNPTENKLLY